MVTFTEPVQVMFSPTEIARLEAIAHAQGRSLDSLIRDAVEAHYLQEDQPNSRLQAVRQLAALSLPVADWEQMERESTSEY
jgi:hypothetical protein